MKRLWNQQKDDADCPNLFSEKGKPSHEWIKDMYEHIFDKDIPKRNGDVLNTRGSCIKNSNLDNDDICLSGEM